MSLESESLGSLSGAIYAAPLGEISTNVARVPHTAMMKPKEPVDCRLEAEDLLHRKIMLSPVAEESPSPRKAKIRLLQPLNPNLVGHYSSSRQDCQNTSPNTNLRLSHVARDKQARTSPTKSFSRPLSPGSQKMQNFLQRLEKQGLSHD